jgi:hypothetical protein
MFPPVSHPTTNGLTPPSFPPISSTSPMQYNQHTYQGNPPIFPPAQQYQPTLINQQNPTPPPQLNLYNPLLVEDISFNRFPIFLSVRIKNPLHQHIPHHHNQQFVQCIHHPHLLIVLKYSNLK